MEYFGEAVLQNQKFQVMYAYVKHYSNGTLTLCFLTLTYA